MKKCRLVAVTLVVTFFVCLKVSIKSRLEAATVLIINSNKKK